MKYLVDKKTKEHRPYYGGSIEWAEDQGLDIVRADSEGWIPHTGTECPLPDDVLCDLKFDNGKLSTVAIASHWGWGNSFITHYRPVLTEKVQEPEPYVDDGTRPEPPPADYRDDLVSRLKAAHAQAQQIPDLEAELREVLGSMGYTLGKLSPFVEPEAAVETDMSDWRNWREGDFVLCIDGNGWEIFSTGMICCVTGFFENGIEINKIQVQQQFVSDFRFHSRPAKGE